ncbi:MAG: glutaminyl-tRNA synthase (glutamine-hydrolyzing) subunit B [Candidatus Lloydbacteria bacterium RIFCSPHIGHO2_01_FULL_49_22]|uniref:Aspartyl/glutamyl-tRNA(Asn/Gln) amidotransferase subunit B n=1 Tax=Candidatus Lloydbacteria bacterium RIFCSPHIGHO2_01_FULL_49_22 TaxID=1798658 RepID=A0A1G2CX48_9BACT|nr:MAG: glutaminyl-tRNA synthase (glutamine-hydrolyzing) subunit B [Candidatus Lloydbacteria bacterium RIFCSPHIGHO2_01_FULL_49_22]OGZ09010.1 MAG: glutaminyl-tRNA synthase (glutamine-hydrolyzing) subunit B [Candidatus Lloydbacteria bacterium RIFCSPHIGHO2_02_FULL_50_18]
MPNYKVTIGLEIHAELKTNTKMFCRCKNDPDEERPNWNICPVCTAQPGTLPVINKKAVKHVLRVGTAIGATLADFTEWDRKNYFYPDIPKGYQISQYLYPLISGGKLAGVDVTRIHLEEDTGSSRHDRGDYSLVDYNRAGVPLMELVTEPVIHDTETAMRFAKELQLLLRYLGASDANMEKGEMRVEANISISETETFGTKVEVKNINSFKAVGDAIAFEIKRHAEVLGRGEKIVQETRGWDENAGKTFSQRKKESANDYRYFPEPDLPKMRISEIPEFQNLNETMPELPWERRLRLSKEFGFQDAITEMFVTDDAIGGFFSDVALKLSGDKDLIKLASNYITSDLAALMKANNGSMGAVTPETFTVLVRMVGAGDVSSRGAKDTLAIMYREGGLARNVAEQHGLIQKSDIGALESIVKDVIAANAEAVAEYKGGKTASLQYIVGQGMKASKGSANPKVLGELFQKLIG